MVWVGLGTGVRLVAGEGVGVGLAETCKLSAGAAVDVVMETRYAGINNRKPAAYKKGLRREKCMIRV